MENILNFMKDQLEVARTHSRNGYNDYAQDLIKTLIDIFEEDVLQGQDAKTKNQISEIFHEFFKLETSPEMKDCSLYLQSKAVL